MMDYLSEPTALTRQSAPLAMPPLLRLLGYEYQLSNTSFSLNFRKHNARSDGFTRNLWHYLAVFLTRGTLAVLGNRA